MSTQKKADSSADNSRERGCPPTDICDGGDACWDICNAWRYGDDEADAALASALTGRSDDFSFLDALEDE